MVRFAVVSWVLAAGPGGLRAQPDPSSADHSRLWQDATRWYDREVELILKHARALHESASRAVRSVRDEEVRERLLADARGMLRHAHRLVPDHPEVIELLAYVEEDSGRTDAALALYRRYWEVPNKNISGRLCVRHGLLLARLNRSQPALRRLRACLDMETTVRAQRTYSHRVYAAVHLGNLHLDRGRVQAALDVLIPGADERPPEPVVIFALAVAFDKDEQLARAYKTLERLDLDNKDIVLSLVGYLDDMDFVPAADRHYFRALLYEAAGYLAEARQEWHNYVRSGKRARFARRARQHIKAIDALLARDRRSARQQPP